MNRCSSIRSGVKNTFLLACLLAFFMLFACSDDESSPREQFIGVWLLTGINLETPMDINQDGTASSDLLQEISCIETTLEILEDNTWTLVTREPRVHEGRFIDDCTDLLTADGDWSLNERGNLLLGDTEYLWQSGQLVQVRLQPVMGIESIVYSKQ